MEQRRIIAVLPTGLAIKNTEKIDLVISDVKTHIIVSELFIFVIKYLKKRGFRNVTIYHIGDKPKNPLAVQPEAKNVSKFKTKGRFTSYIELLEALKQDSTEILEI